MPLDPFTAPDSIASGVTGDTSAWAVIAGIFEGLSEGARIIMAMIILLALVLVFFGRSLGKKLAAVVDASLAAAAEAKKAKEEAAAAKTQAATATLSVTNSHSTHVRDDIDNNQRLLMAKLEAVVDGIAEVKSDVGGIRSEIREDRRRVNSLSERLSAHLDSKE